MQKQKNLFKRQSNQQKRPQDNLDGRIIIQLFRSN